MEEKSNVIAFPKTYRGESDCAVADRLGLLNIQAAVVLAIDNEGNVSVCLDEELSSYSLVRILEKALAQVLVSEKLV